MNSPCHSNHNHQEPVDRRIEADIIATLKKIGFPDQLEEWKTASPVIDPFSETLHLSGHPVMSGWERPYMRKLAEISTSKAQSGKVLELGFGLGISAGFIQEYSPAEHVIIEMNQSIAELGRQFATRQATPVTILEGMWQDVVPQLPSNSFQGILFDTYPLTEEEVDVIFHPFLPHAHRLLAPGGILTYYSDEATWFSDDHLGALRNAGFTKITGVLCEVPVPPDCQYWRQNTILAPIVEK